MGNILKDKVAVITGSGQGIGRAIAIGMAGEGAKIITNNRRRGSTGYAQLNDSLVNSLSKEKQEWLRKQAEEANGDAKTTAETIKKSGGDALPFFGDISDFDIAGKLVRAAVDAYGKIDIVVNVAGTFGFSPVWEITEETWDRVTNTKPKGYFNIIRHALPYMMKQKWGRIINCTSRAFLGDVLKHAEYCAANAGVVGLTKAVAKEVYQYGITCNAFAPFARTRAAFELAAYDMAVGKEESPWMDRKFAFPLEAAPSPEYIVPFLIYLSTKAADKISGSVFNVGGNNISLFSEPEISHSLVKYGDPWTIEELNQQAPRGLFENYVSPAKIKDIP
jgi:3-oxoacyl-[acyl-carrier protein] reductase